MFFISSNRFLEEMLKTTLHRPTHSHLPLKPSMFVFTPKSAGGTVPYGWSSSAVSWQVGELQCSKWTVASWCFYSSFRGLSSSKRFKQVRLLLLLLLQGCSEPLGMKSGHIQDYQVTASSIFRTLNMDMFTWEPGKARLDKQGKVNAWTAGHSDQSQWLQVR